MSDRSFSDAVRGVGRNALDVPVAALAALAVAFVTFAMPPDLLSQLVGSTGLPELLPAAEPPLGMKARIGVGAAGAIAIFALVFGLLRLLDRRADRRSEEAASEEEPPRLRRRDFHPDAPARRPLSAVLELGEPEELQPVASAAQPLWLSPAEPGEEELEEDEAEPDAPVEEDSVEEEEILLHEVPEENVEAEAHYQSAAFEPEFHVSRTDSLEETAPDSVDSCDPEPREPEPAVEDVRPTASIGELMARLEQGLARRQARPQPAPPMEVSTPVSQAVAEPADDRLQSAIDSLQRLAARQG